MKKSLLSIVVIIALLCGCEKNEPSNPTASELQITSGTSNETKATEIDTATNGAAIFESEQQEVDNAVKNSLPDNVVLSIAENILSDNELTEIHYDENDMWYGAAYDDFVYLTEPSENNYKRFNIGDEICGLKLVSAHNVFHNDYEDNEYHESYFYTSIAEFKGEVTLSGTIKIEEEDGINLYFQKGDIIFSPEENENIFPLLSGMMYEYYDEVRCGNIGDDVIPDLLLLPVGEEIKAEITVSDITLCQAMPMYTRVLCKIDSINILK